MNGQVSRTYLAYVILLLFLVNAANYGQRMIIAIILPAINFIGNLTYVAIAVVGGLRVASGAMLLGSVQAFF